VAQALAAIVEAQRQLECAHQRLARVSGMTVEWRQVGRLHERAQRARHNITARRAQIRRKGGLALDELV
jgi:hypothetical protein